LIERWRTRVSRMVLGGSLIAVSLLALAAPLATGTWSLQFLGLFPLAVGISDLYAAVTNPELRSHPMSYATGILAIAVALLLYVSPLMVVSGIVTLLLVFLAFDGILKLGHTILGPASNTPRVISALNGMSSLCLALIGWALWQKVSGATAIGVAVAGYTAMAGWRLLAAPDSAQENIGTSEEIEAHPDAGLCLGRHALFGTINARRSASNPDVRRAETYLFLVIGLVLFAIHISRLDSSTWLGLISPFVATVGDVLMAIMLGALLVLPVRLVWRRLSRPVERKAWQLRFSGQDVAMAALPRGLLREWTNARYSFSASLRHARVSLPSAAGLVVRLGFPLAVLFAAINPIWGANWYFNTESWASGFYQKITELRVDTWRASMDDAIIAAYGGSAASLFRVTPAGIDTQDFSFIVIGDTGEGDASQYSLVERYLDIGQRDDVKFLVVSSDVIYPAGAMTDYENNFYLPFKGFKKPVYAIPGNHDWFDALEAFNANFLEPKAARAALSARVKADFNLTSTDKGRIDRLLRQAQHLRDLYGVQNAVQRGPFFELQTKDFALLAIDTGIRRTIDDHQLRWLEGALARSRGKFTMAIVGHPKYAGGYDTTKNADEFSTRVSESGPNWISNSILTTSYAAAQESDRPLLSRDTSLSTRDLYAMLERAGVEVVMAGDTHAFEYYLQEPGHGQNRRAVHYFVNGGGGAYLSVGGALAWPETAPTKQWAFYPGTKAVYAKLDTETPAWKWPVWFWIKRFGAWPLSIETLSSLFDFNHAPFYQSFVEVRVERSRNRIVFALQGVNGAVLWQDLNVSPDGVLAGKPNSPVEFIVTLAPPKT
jgi:uncharacterized membrane protein HdeD (DUF308 family)/3',5'-cyclic AMP phosphodiesterase CpdA